MKFRLIHFSLALLFAANLSAQTWEIGLSGGVSYYVGDLNPTFHFRFPHPAGSIYGKRNFGKHWSVRAGFSYMHVSADDEVGLFGFQQTRNLRFESDIFELSGVVEFNFFPYRPGDDNYKKWTPYIFVGIAGFYYNPYVFYNNEQVGLQQLGTEGQGTPSTNFRRRYSLFQPTIPFGLGFKWSVSDRFSIGMEYGMRLLFTDYLDDVSNVYGPSGEILQYSGAVAADLSDESRGPWSAFSNDNYQRGIRNDNDWYGYVGITFSYNIKDPTACPGYRVRHKWKPKRLKLKRKK